MILTREILHHNSKCEMLCKKMVIYKIQKLRSKKIYIGKTARTLAERLKEHLKESSTFYGKSYIDNALKKYGIEKFDIVIIAECETQEQLNELEKYWIKFYDCKRPIGYNLTDGGEGTLGHIVTKATRQKISKSKTGKKTKPHTQQTKDKIGAANKGRKVSQEVRKILSEKHTGKKLSEKTRANMSAAKKNKRPVICLETEIIFTSVASAAKWAGIVPCTLTSVLRGRTITAGGYHWKYFDDN